MKSCRFMLKYSPYHHWSGVSWGFLWSIVPKTNATDSGAPPVVFVCLCYKHMYIQIYIIMYIYICIHILTYMITPFTTDISTTVNRKSKSHSYLLRTKPLVYSAQAARTSKQCWRRCRKKAPCFHDAAGQGSVRRLFFRRRWLGLRLIANGCFL